MVSPDLRPASPDSETVLLDSETVLVSVIRFLSVQKKICTLSFLVSSLENRVPGVSGMFFFTTT